MFNSASSIQKELDSKTTLTPVTEADADLNEQWTKFDENQGEKRPLSEAEEKVYIPITEKQLTILKKRATELINKLDEILDLDFVRDIQKKSICNFISARGNLRHYLKRFTTSVGEADNSQQSQPRKRPRRAQSDNNSRNSFAVAQRNSRQRGSVAPSWPRPSDWSRNREVPFNQRSRRQWGSDYEQPYSRVSPRVSPRFSSSRRAGGGGGFFLQRDNYQIPATRDFRSISPLNNRPWPRAPRSTSNSARNMDRRKSTRTRDDVWRRCELCDVQLCGEKSVKEHMVGKRHRLALEAKEGGSMVKNESEPTMHEINIGNKK